MNKLFRTVLLSIAIMLPVAVLAKVNIVTTTTDLASLAKSVGGTLVDVHSLQTGNRNPHYLQAKPSYIMKAKRADLWILVGLELEIGYEPVIIEAARNPRIKPGRVGYLDASQGIQVLEKPTGPVDRSMGDIHPGGNPHYWLDPYNGRLIAQSICARLKKIDPTHAARYDENLMTLLKEIDDAVFGQSLVEQVGGQALWQATLQGNLADYLSGQQMEQALGGLMAQLKPLANKEIITFHKSWSYFLNRFQLRSAGQLEPKPGIPPAPDDLKKVIDLVNKRQIKIILLENYYPIKAAEFVADKTQAKVVVASSMVGGQPEANDYISMLENIANKLVAAMASSQ